ncbi:MAG: SpoIIE family protein phosphatase [Bacteroidales bacterium]|nr:SpoIIE family protein phosphatase [Bacteroidales bacterium]
MKKFFLFIIIVGLMPIMSFSQINKDGLPFIEKYTDKDYGDAGQVWAITQDKRGVMYFGCNYGLKTFDGKTWKSYNNPYSTIIKSLAVTDNNLVFYGSESDFGVLLPDSSGNINFYSLFIEYYPENTVQDFSSVWKTLIADNRVYFQSFEKIFYMDLPLKIDANGKLLNHIRHIEPDKTIFHLSFSVNNKLYIREWEKGLSIIKDDKAVLIPGGEQFAYSRIYGMLPYDENNILIVTRSSGFFLYDTSKNKNAISPFITSNDELIAGSSLYSCEMLHDGTYALGTFNNGIIVFDKKGNITQHLNEETGGLTSHYIYSTFCNQEIDNAPLWFFNDDDGIYCADYTGPFKKWNEYTGLPGGSVTDAIRHNGQLFLTTINAIYYLQDSLTVEKFVKIDNVSEGWDMTEFIVPETGEKKLLMGSSQGVFDVSPTGLNQIVELQQAYKLYQSTKNPEYLYVGSIEGLYLIKYENGTWTNEGKHDSIHYQIKSIYEDENFLALGANSGVIILDDFFDNSITVVDSTRNLHLLGQDYFLQKYNGKLLIASGAGLYTLDATDTTAVHLFDFGKQFADTTKGVFNFREDTDGYWMSIYETNTNNANHQLIRFIGKDKLEKDSVFSKILPQKSSLCIYPDGNYVWIGNEKGLFKFDKTIIKNYSVEFNTLISKVSTGSDSILFLGNYSESIDNIPAITSFQQKEIIPVLSFKYNKIAFEWAAAYFERNDQTVYSYRLLGETEKWSKWTKKSDTRYTNLFEGDYTFEVKARNIYDTESSVAQYSFTILPPWYRTLWAYFVFFVLGILAIFVIIKLYTKKLKRENEKLEQTVKERTAEIRMQNEEITAQRDEIQEQKEQVEKSKEKIEKQQKHIMDSIHYASRIQEAVLPPDDYLQDILGNHFVLFKPRDIVSGDFYWATQRGNKTVIVAADCTGHGVPGAFMSMLGISFLNEIVNKEEILQANHILNRLRENVKRSLRQTGKENEAKDGMDLALCIIDMDNMQLQFAGAYNPLYILRDDEIIRIKPDRMPIGIYLREKESFTNNVVDIQKGDLLYIFSDGFVDQFGGEKDKKIRSNVFKEILLKNNKKSMDAQKEELVKYLDYWMSFKDKSGRNYKQVDDILVVGIEI